MTGVAGLFILLSPGCWRLCYARGRERIVYVRPGVLEVPGGAGRSRAGRARHTAQPLALEIEERLSGPREVLSGADERLELSLLRGLSSGCLAASPASARRIGFAKQVSQSLPIHILLLFRVDSSGFYGLVPHGLRRTSLCEQSCPSLSAGLESNESRVPQIHC